MAAVDPGNLRHRLDAGDVGSKGGDRHAALAARHDIDQPFAHPRLGAGGALDQRVSGIADHGDDALVADGAECRLVGRVHDQGIGVEFPVAGVQHRTRRRSDGECVRLQDRVGDGEEGDLERGERDLAAERHDMDGNLILQVVFAKLAAKHGGGERRGKDRAAQARPEKRNGAQVILVRMGQHQAQEIVAPLGDEGRVRRDQIDPGRRLVGEGDAEVDHQPLAGMTVEIQVHADFARPAQWQKQQIGRRPPVERRGLSHGCSDGRSPPGPAW